MDDKASEEISKKLEEIWSQYNIQEDDKDILEKYADEIVKIGTPNPMTKEEQDFIIDHGWALSSSTYPPRNYKMKFKK